MKTLGKNILPEYHFNPIARDLLLVVTASLILAVAVVSFGVMVMSQL